METIWNHGMIRYISPSAPTWPFARFFVGMMILAGRLVAISFRFEQCAS